MFQATMAVPGQVIPNDPARELAILNGERLFDQIGCNSCHVDALPLDHRGWIYSEPSPYNPAGNLQVGEEKYPLTSQPLTVELTSMLLTQPGLHPSELALVISADNPA